jgi:hypothetical protein
VAALSACDAAFPMGSMGMWDNSTAVEAPCMRGRLRQVVIDAIGAATQLRFRGGGEHARDRARVPIFIKGWI